MRLRNRVATAADYGCQCGCESVAGRFLLLGSEVSRIEQAMNFAKQRRETLARDLEQTLEGKQRELVWLTRIVSA